MMQCGRDAAGIFKTMAEVHEVFKLTSSLDDSGSACTTKSVEHGLSRRLSFSSEKDTSAEQDSSTTRTALQSVPDDSRSCRTSAEIVEQHLPTAASTFIDAKNESPSKDISRNCSSNSQQQNVNSSEDKENVATPSSVITADIIHEDTSRDSSLQESDEIANKQHSNTEDNDAEVVKRAQEQGCVDVVFPGTVTQEGCCRFVSEILKCILYQRQQLPMTYDQLLYSQQKRQSSVQDKDTVNRRLVQSADMDGRKCQQTLQDLEEVLQQLEVLFSLSRVPRVLFLMGGSLVLPKELYEINMEALVLAGGDQCLRVSSCLRQLFRTLFVADLLSDTRPVRLMPTTVLVLAHRDCGVGWFRPKLQFKVPACVKKQIIALSTDPSSCKEPRAEVLDWQDYVWFQAPLTIKGFCN
ncbi:MAD2L1-binding protein [Solea senegalensis]|uniref:MAD2L1-binding protein n=2 Tax=Solea senegalensis TaxID=28829 RepID=A0AAV6S690_SOLSE|nr:MAD2L1-binding protein [Solea senegalensis]KAG7512751.1 MAD2L1-binding protein [Solea senegalensis]